MSIGTCRKILEMVRELHLRGFEFLRAAPGMSNSGMHWRCPITPVSNVWPNHGARIVNWDDQVARFTSADEDRPYGWSDVTDYTLPQLADKFIESFPAIAAAGVGRDPAYVEWYREMLEATAPETFPIAYADWDLPKDHLETFGPKKLKLPMPPLRP